MAQSTQKKSGAANSNARTAASMADKAAKSAFTAAKNTRENAENVVRLSGNTMRDILNSSATEAQRAKDKMFEMSRESTARLVQSADSATRTMVDMIGIARDNAEACIECCNVSANLAKEVSTELTEYCNQLFSDMMEVSKDAFACRTINDVMELQSRLLRTTLDGLTNQSVKLSNMCFEYATEALEPINERIVEANEQLSKTLASAA